MLIGKKIKELRKSQKMTLTELSRMSGIQLATLSRMENEKMTGTLESHMNIAKALGINITELYRDIEPEAEKIALQRDDEQKDVFVHSDKSSFEILTGKVLSKKMMPILLRVEAQGRTATEQNKAGTEKFIYVLEGDMEANIEDKTYPLSKGNTLYFDASLKHYFVNSGKSVTRFLCVTTPVTL